MSESDALKAPTRTTGAEVASVLAEAGTSLIPVVGGPLAVVVATLFGYSFEKRLAAWREQVIETIRRLQEERGIAPEELAENDQFLGAVATATYIAETTASQEKRDYLAAALYNIGAGTDLLPDKQAIYLRYIDELTASHMRMLAFLNDPPEYLASCDIPWPDIMGGLGNIVQRALPELYSDKPLLDTVVGDLQRYGLAQNPGLNTIMTGQGLRAPRGTEKGVEFVKFITDPPPQ